MLAGVLAQAQANPVSVTVGGTVYRLTTSTSRISYSSDPALFQSQPWWGNASLAGEISSAVQYSLGGYINNAATSGPSAFVGYDLNGSAVSLLVNLDVKADICALLTFRYCTRHRAV